ncbi:MULTISPECIES: ash family protein [Dickeya]|uniref:ash family protein n=2 Tax=Pectobacteriaceae TaxID=1903410 RepID=UPI0013862CBA|nr:ash family protein [Dickeya fangzhongdai]MZH98810.1 ash family protein [Dickeya dianthicola]
MLRATKPLAARRRWRYLLPAPAQSGVGIGLPNCYRRYMTRLASFFMPKIQHVYRIMVGWAGAPQGAPVSCNAGKTNSAQSTTQDWSLWWWV